VTGGGEWRFDLLRGLGWRKDRAMGGDIKRDEYEDEGLIDTDCNGEFMEATELSRCDAPGCGELGRCWLLLRWTWIL